MKGKFVLAVALCAMTAYADRIPLSASATINWDNTTPQGSDYDWNYTISVDNGNLANVASIEIFDVGGVVSVSAPCGFTCEFPFWTATSQSLGDGLYDVTFTNNFSYFDDFNHSQDGFVIESTYGSGTQAQYNVTYSNDFDPGSTVGAPEGSAPEPASLALTGLALVALGGLKFRRS